MIAATVFTLDAPQRIVQRDLAIAISKESPLHMRLESFQRLAWCDINLASIDLTEEQLPGIDLKGGNLENSNFSKAILNGAKFSGADVRGANFSKANLTSASFNGAAIGEANFDQAILNSASFSGMSQRDEVRPEKASFRNASLVKANFSSRSTSVSRNPLGFIPFEEKEETRTVLFPTAFFYSSDFRGADLTESNLSYTSFAGSDFRGANLSSANLTGASLKDIQWDENTKWDDANIEAASDISEGLK